jgi:hypothetical protein
VTVSERRELSREPFFKDYGCEESVGTEHPLTADRRPKKGVLSCLLDQWLDKDLGWATKKPRKSNKNKINSGTRIKRWLCRDDLKLGEIELLGWLWHSGTISCGGATVPRFLEMREHPHFSAVLGAGQLEVSPSPLYQASSLTAARNVARP